MQKSFGTNGLSSRVGAFLLTGAVLLAGCGASTPPGDAARIDPKLVANLDPADARVVGQAVNAFGFDLWGAVAADGKQNVITSPLSVAVLLAMVLAGAGSDTAEEMAKVLHLENRRDVRVGALLRTLADTDEVTLSVANGAWADQGAPFEADYLTFVRNTFGATLEQGDLGSGETAKAIDAWADKNTKGLIRDIAADLGLPNPDALLVLLNAVYFLGVWKTKFDQAQTTQQQFTLADGSKVDVPTMRLSGAKFGYTQRDGYRMLRLPYGENGRYGMEVLLPDDGNTVAKVLGSLDANGWRAAVDSLQEQAIDQLTLPRFELRWKGELTEALKKLGMPTAFEARKADFRPMSQWAPYLERVVHKTYIKVDENGTEAAAVTGATMQTTSAKPPGTVFRVDRPFAFTISDQQTGTILFQGTVADPRA
jgi:serine protease inhibitor